MFNIIISQFGCVLLIDIRRKMLSPASAGESIFRTFPSRRQAARAKLFTDSNTHQKREIII